jgi:Cft2 family RNA processing exonuclease
MGITELLKQQTDNLLSEDSLGEIEKAFNEAVNQKAKIGIEQALFEQDADYAGKLKKLLEVVDKDHTQKLIKVVEAIDTNHAYKLKQLVVKFNKELNNGAKGFKDSMINNISTYLEAYLDESIPAQKINEAVESKRSQIILQQIKEMLGVDSALAKKSIKAAVVDGKRQIDEANTRLEAALKELQQIKESYNTTKGDLVLEKKLSSVEGRKRKYLEKVMRGKTADFIAENFDYAANLFDKDKSKQLQTLKEEATEEIRSTSIDRPVLEESVVEESNADMNSYMSPYLTELNKF